MDLQVLFSKVCDIFSVNIDIADINFSDCFHSRFGAGELFHITVPVLTDISQFFIFRLCSNMSKHYYGLTG